MKQSDPVRYREYLKSIAARSLEAPEIRPDPPLRYHPEVDDYTMSAGMALTPGGRIWIVWFGGNDGPAAFMDAAWSDDGGRTFSEPKFVLDAGYVDTIHRSVVVGNLWTAPDGRLFWFFTLSVGYYDGRGGSWYTVCENPDSGRPVWSRPVRIWHGASLNKPAVLADGTWLLPVSLWRQDYAAFEPGCPRITDLYPELDAERQAWIFASTDAGRTWERRGGVRNLAPATFDEHMIVERNDGSLLMYLRCDHGSCLTQTESADGGRTWSVPVYTPFNSASARYFLRKLASGNLLMVRYSNPEQPHDRSFLTAYISRDGGRSWEGGLLLDGRPRISYPDGFQAPDGRIYIQYDRLRESGEILLAVFTEDDVLAGRDVSGKVILKHPVIQSRTQKLLSEASRA